MRVDQIMTDAVTSCESDSDLASAIRLMHEQRCGALPVVDGDQHVVGILTDRDIVLALGAADVRPSQLLVTAAMTFNPRTCRADETAQQALTYMQKQQVRRLPVVDDHDRLVGVISIDDVVLVAQNVRAGVSRVTYEQAMAALEAICARSTGEDRLADSRQR